MALPNATVARAMSPRSARALALVLAMASLAGCGSNAATRSDDIALTVTRDFGAEAVVSGAAERVPEAGGLTQILQPYRNTRGTQSLFVNGILADEPLDELEVHGGDRVWLDQHPPGVASRIPAVVGAFPQPFVNGIGGKRLPVRVECDEPRAGACASTPVRSRGWRAPATRSTRRSPR